MTGSLSSSVTLYDIVRERQRSLDNSEGWAVFAASVQALQDQLLVFSSRSDGASHRRSKASETALRGSRACSSCENLVIVTPHTLRLHQHGRVTFGVGNLTESVARDLFSSLAESDPVSRQIFHHFQRGAESQRLPTDTDRLLLQSHVEQLGVLTLCRTLLDSLESPIQEESISSVQTGCNEVEDLYVLLYEVVNQTEIGKVPPLLQLLQTVEKHLRKPKLNEKGGKSLFGVSSVISQLVNTAALIRREFVADRILNKSVSTSNCSNVGKVTESFTRPLAGGQSQTSITTSVRVKQSCRRSVSSLALSGETFAPSTDMDLQHQLGHGHSNQPVVTSIICPEPTWAGPGGGLNSASSSQASSSYTSTLSSDSGPPVKTRYNSRHSSNSDAGYGLRNRLMSSMPELIGSMPNLLEEDRTEDASRRPGQYGRRLGEFKGHHHQPPLSDRLARKFPASSGSKWDPHQPQPPQDAAGKTRMELRRRQSSSECHLADITQLRDMDATYAYTGFAKMPLALKHASSAAKLRHARATAVSMRRERGGQLGPNETAVGQAWARPAPPSCSELMYRLDQNQITGPEFILRSQLPMKRIDLRSPAALVGQSQHLLLCVLLSGERIEVVYNESTTVGDVIKGAMFQSSHPHEDKENTSGLRGHSAESVGSISGTGLFCRYSNYAQRTRNTRVAQQRDLIDIDSQEWLYLSPNTRIVQIDLMASLSSLTAGQSKPERPDGEQKQSTGPILYQRVIPGSRSASGLPQSAAGQHDLMPWIDRVDQAYLQIRQCLLGSMSHKLNAVHHITLAAMALRLEIPNMPEEVTDNITVSSERFRVEHYLPWEVVHRTGRSAARGQLLKAYHERCRMRPVDADNKREQQLEYCQAAMQMLPDCLSFQYLCQTEAGDVKTSGDPVVLSVSPVGIKIIPTAAWHETAAANPQQPINIQRHDHHQPITGQHSGHQPITAKQHPWLSVNLRTVNVLTGSLELNVGKQSNDVYRLQMGNRARYVGGLIVLYCRQQSSQLADSAGLMGGVTKHGRPSEVKRSSTSGELTRSASMKSDSGKRPQRARTIRRLYNKVMSHVNDATKAKPDEFRRKRRSLPSLGNALKRPLESPPGSLNMNARYSLRRLTRYSSMAANKLLKSSSSVATLVEAVNTTTCSNSSSASSQMSTMDTASKLSSNLSYRYKCYLENEDDESFAQAGPSLSDATQAVEASKHGQGSSSNHVSSNTSNHTGKRRSLPTALSRLKSKVAEDHQRQPMKMDSEQVNCVGRATGVQLESPNNKWRSVRMGTRALTRSSLSSTSLHQLSDEMTATGDKKAANASAVGGSAGRAQVPPESGGVGRNPEAHKDVDDYRVLLDAQLSALPGYTDRHSGRSKKGNNNNNNPLIKSTASSIATAPQQPPQNSFTSSAMHQVGKWVLRSEMDRNGADLAEATENPADAVLEGKVEEMEGTNLDTSLSVSLLERFEGMESADWEPQRRTLTVTMRRDTRTGRLGVKITHTPGGIFVEGGGGVSGIQATGSQDQSSSSPVAASSAGAKASTPKPTSEGNLWRRSTGVTTRASSVEQQPEGLERGDQILAVNGQFIQHMDYSQVLALIAAQPDPIRFTVSRLNGQ